MKIVKLAAAAAFAVSFAGVFAASSAAVPLHGPIGKGVHAVNNIASHFTRCIVGNHDETHDFPSINVNGLDPGVYTLQFSFSGVNPPGVIPRAQAIINWTSGGQPQRRVISIVSGASISAPCEGVNVTIQDQGDTEGVPANTQYQVQTTLAMGARPNVQQPALLITEDAVSLQVGTPLVLDIPQDSGVISVYVFAAPAAAAGGGAAPSDYDVFVDTTDGSGNQVGAGFYAAKKAGWVPLPPGTAKVILHNNSALGEYAANVLWGIDG